MACLRPPSGISFNVSVFPTRVRVLTTSRATAGRFLGRALKRAVTEHPPAKRVPGRLLGYAALGLCAAIALYYSLHSLHLAATLTRSMPYHDHWMWVVSDYFHYLDGRYSVWRLFAQVGESEHRLLTTKLVLFADAILFQMRGVFPTALMYFCLAGVASPAKRDIAYPGSGVVVGAARFELATPCSQSRCATRLRYAPIARFALHIHSSRECGKPGPAWAASAGTRRRAAGSLRPLA